MAGCYQIPLPVVQSILGHMSPEMTKHYQAHADRTAKEKYLAQMPDFLGLPGASVRSEEHDADREELNRLLRSLNSAQIQEVSAFVRSLL